MLLRGQEEVAMIFADIQLSGEMDGMGLAREVKTVELGYPLPRQLRMLREVIR